ncbi:crocetin glucosyltransferase, chloroplastic-like [Rhododendron vialii]|uniref:crocetin glucosyltransferase, chloroplastic-like n=1 Tax=Rhododendron vialii TaxID=182163 RepID=UPI0026603E40|nr:crocetin glucosyltransferase, chloroplastic-like [Rhododendron vialii]
MHSQAFSYLNSENQVLFLGRKDMEDSTVRLLLVTFPGQGHINPSLQFAKRLVKMGVDVTFVTAFSALNRMSKSTAATPQGLTFSGFSDGYDDGVQIGDRYADELRARGSEAIAKLLKSEAERGQPFIHVVYTTLLPFVGQVARALHVSSTFLWIQPATILGIYYYYINGYGDSIGKNMNDPSWSIELPGLTVLTGRDLPSFLLASNTFNFALPLLEEHFEILDTEANPKVLVNTFDALEAAALRAIEKLNLVAVGPLIPSAFLDGKDPSDTSFGGDLFQDSKAYIEWLNTKASESVVYVAFGTLSAIETQQMEEIAHGLLQCGRPFLWVVRGSEEEKLSCKEQLEQQGMIVPWCSQVEVLSHSSIGCFITHCGWNSSLESLVSGVPVVAFPQWSDQATNGKLIEDVWETGVRVTRNEEGIVESDEIKKCIEVVMGGDEMRNNAKKWKDLGREAFKEGGSSDKNLKTFVEEIRVSLVK